MSIIFSLIPQQKYLELLKSYLRNEIDPQFPRKILQTILNFILTYSRFQFKMNKQCRKTKCDLQSELRM